MQDEIARFLASPAFAVAGASKNRSKYGNKVLRCYLQKQKQVYPVHPSEASIEEVVCVKTIKELPPDVKSLSIITPPPVTEQLVKDAIAHGIESIWMQPGAESPEAVRLCKEHKINVIADGSCILVVLGYHED